MKILTQEQENIISTSQQMLANESLKIQACAGSGKTSTLVEISKANPNSSFLYLAFNKSIVEEAKNKFPANVSVKTTHSLAYANIIAPRGYQVVPKHTFFDLKDILGINNYDDFSIFNKELNFFLNSSITSFTSPEIERLFEAVRNKEIPYTHSLYLKEYQMLPRKAKKLDKFDFILLDEAQDTNGVTLGIFMDNTCKKIIVGDTFQNIYGFRDTVNALQKMDTNFTQSLTHSFRCNQSILSKACYFLNKYSDSDEVFFKSAFKENDEPKTEALITRTNAGIIDVIANNEKFKYKLIKEPEAIFAASLSAYNFKMGDFSKIHKDYKWIANFSGIEDLKDFAEATFDVELTKAIELSNKYGDELFELYEVAKQMHKAKEFDVYLTNAHISKGLEWDKITLYDDFPALKDINEKLFNERDKKEKERLNKYLQGEVNLYYVALTRAKEKVIDRTDNQDEYMEFMAKLKDGKTEKESQKHEKKVGVIKKKR